MPGLPVWRPCSNSALNLLCNKEQAPFPLWASVSPSVKQDVTLDQWLSTGAAYPKATPLRCPKSRECPGVHALQKHLSNSGTSFCPPGSWVSPSPTRCIESPFRTLPGWHSNPATPLVPHCSTDCVTASSGHTASWAGRPQCLDTSHAYYRKRPPSQERKFSNQGNR